GPGDPCEENGIITQCAGNSICANGYCTCPGGEPVINGICMSRDSQAGPDEPCQMGITRCTGGSFCMHNLCICPRGQVSFRGQCTPVLIASVYPNQPCNFRSKCVGGSSCIEGMCRCPNGMSALPNSPICSIIIRKIYAYFYAISVSLTGAPGQRCDTTNLREPCRGDSLCVNDMCICPSNRVVFGDKCVIFEGEVGPGYSCAQEGVICGGGSTCNNGVFAPGAKCTSICASCAQCGGGSICWDGYCRCPLGYNAVDTRCTPIILTSVVIIVRPGDKCSAKAICGGGSSCIIGRCVCSPGYVPNNERDSCINALLNPSTVAGVNPGEECTMSTACNGGATCIHNICACPANSYISNNICVIRQFPKSLYLGSACALIDYCQRNSQCIRGYCICNSDQVVDANGYCISKLSNPLEQRGMAGSRCETATYHCRSSLMCTSWGYCVCSNGYEGNGLGECTPETIPRMLPFHAHIEAKCNSNNECTGHHVCIKGQCLCPQGSQEGPNGSCITRRSLVPPGSWCDGSTAICSGGSNCHQNNLEPTTESYKRFTRDPSTTPILNCPIDGSCRLPDCFCSRSGLEVPNGLHPIEIPQIVLLTFSGPVHSLTINIFKSLFNGRFRNPNGCPIKGTFFVSHEWNNYDQTQWLLSQGHEIGVNSITGDNLRNESLRRWHDEMIGMREALQHFSYASFDEIVGIRAPYFQFGGENQFNMMEASGFLYDNSMKINGGPFWPQTMDYSLAWNCTEYDCPRKPYRGLWAIPIHQLITDNPRVKIGMIDEIIQIFDSPEKIADVLYKNFLRSYNYNKAPFVVAMESKFLTSLTYDRALIALEIFITKVLNNSDTYIVTASQAIKWIETPVRLLKVHSFSPWTCKLLSNHHILPCENPSTCSFVCEKGEAHVFSICGSCPRVYPKLGDPLGVGNA
ncbi:unnamed protein product, partial [Dracunculus medinensis]|uniref:EB module n=1 Tax=Dracunculus medinensis TaxID=318479 RepID=A0A158Q5W1_DRAME